MKIIIFIIILISWITISAQEIKKTQDLGLWTGVSVEYNLNKQFHFEFSQDIRFFESLTELDKYITDLGVDYKINKNFKLGGDLRYYLNKEKDKTISQNWRYNVDLKSKFKIASKLKIKYRLRFQSNYEELFGAVFQGRKSNLRNKISIDYKRNKKNSFYSGAEIFRELVYYRKPYFNKVRLTLGSDFTLKIGKVDLSIGYERELSSDHPFNYLFGRIYYTFKIKNEK